MSDFSNPSLYIGTTGLVVAIGGSIYNNQQIKSLTETVNIQGKGLQGYIQKLKELQNLDKSTKEATDAVRELKSITEDVINSNDQMKPLVKSIADQQILTQHYMREMMKSIDKINAFIADQGGEIYTPQKFTQNNEFSHRPQQHSNMYQSVNNNNNNNRVNTAPPRRQQSTDYNEQMNGYQSEVPTNSYNNSSTFNNNNRMPNYNHKGPTVRGQLQPHNRNIQQQKQVAFDDPEAQLEAMRNNS